MRKGIVMEQGHHFTIVMSSDGAFYKSQPIEAEIGAEIEFKAMTEERSVRKQAWLFSQRNMKVAALAMALCVALFPLFLCYGSNRAYAYVNIDINPSVELKLNNKMEVLEIHPLNKDAKGIVSHMEHWKRKKASEVTLDMISLSQEYGYMNKKNEVLIGISYVKNSHTKDFTKEIETYLEKKSLPVSIAAYEVPEDIRKQAKQKKGSVNKEMARTIGKDNKTSKETSVAQNVHIGDEDKAIIQSFYQEDHPSPAAEPSTSSQPAAKPQVISGKAEDQEQPSNDRSTPPKDNVEKDNSPAAKQKGRKTFPSNKTEKKAVENHNEKHGPKPSSENPSKSKDKSKKTFKQENHGRHSPAHHEHGKSHQSNNRHHSADKKHKHPGRNKHDNDKAKQEDKYKKEREHHRSH
ncbi:hypothetical protein Q7A53_06370 [Halobacillus rhizosphaerae]|uniref:anti-sigma-I factor RsgI family protein n=1 Tax=Halobacillus rhizosphaerae TaxID=3064889 RepID=UPI00398B9E4C